LKNNFFSTGKYSLVPIRYQDRMNIMQWRNEQIFHLRQAKPLTETDQNNYFNNIVAKLFEQEQPSQILFSYLEDNECIGYGGLVHINWVDKNAEISFILNTRLEKDFFHIHWGVYLDLLEQVAFMELDLHKIYTYAFDLRPHLYEAIETKGYNKEAILKEHCCINNRFKDVIIHSKIKSTLFLRKATINDAKLLFDWTNEEEVRATAVIKKKIEWNEHINWLTNKLQSDKTHLFILNNDMNENIGVVRFDKDSDIFNISYSIDKNHRGKGFGHLILQLGIKRMIENEAHSKFVASVQTDNIASNKIFMQLGFILEKTELLGNHFFNFYCKDGNE